MDLVDPSYELIDPTPNIHDLFVLFTDQLFYGALGACTVEWNELMTTCAGICSFHSNTGLCSIRLSEPLLKLRSRKDLIQTLLHEMIHAYLFVTQRVCDRDYHGPDFQEHMHRINATTGTKITIYHSFHAEVHPTYSTTNDDQAKKRRIMDLADFSFHADANPTNSLAKSHQTKKRRIMDLVDPSYELIDPTPNIHDLFVLFADQLFYGALGACTVEWSKRMTTCAGICSFHPNTGLCSIRLSEPLLKLRPRKDLIQTLLHEMIHAYLFVTQRVRDRDGHGPKFQEHMHRINATTGTKITIYHSFHAEVALYKQKSRS